MTTITVRVRTTTARGQPVWESQVYPDLQPGDSIIIRDKQGKAVIVTVEKQSGWVRLIRRLEQALDR